MSACRPLAVRIILRTSELGIGPDGCEDLETRTAWHPTSSSRRAGFLSLIKVQALFAVASLDHLGGRFDGAMNEAAKVGLVVDDQNRLPLADALREMRLKAVPQMCSCPKPRPLPVIRRPAR